MSQSRCAVVVDEKNPLVVRRLRIEKSVYYAVQEPAVETESPPVLVIAIHGYGQSCKSFMKFLAPLKDRNFMVVAPQGPNMLYWQRRPAKVGFCWMTRYMKEDTLEDLYGYMERLYGDLEANFTFDHERVFLLGFSQGSILAQRVAAAGVIPARGLVVCAGDLPADVGDKLAELPKRPVLIVHGEGDRSMKIACAREAEKAYRDQGFDVETLYYKGGHDFPSDHLDTIADWIESH